MMRRLVRIAFCACLMVMVGALGAGAWAGYLQLTGNIHRVEPGVYRSNQLPADTMAALVREKAIRTVLNLRGDGGPEEWYVAESRAVSSAGARLIDLQMSANNEPDDALIRQRVATLRTAEQPRSDSLPWRCRSHGPRFGAL